MQTNYYSAKGGSAFGGKIILTWIIKIGLFIIPFIPLYIAAGLFFPFITGKAFVFRGIVEVVFALWLVLIVFYKEFRPKKNSLLWAIAIFIGIVTLATVTGVNTLRSFWSNFERMEGLVMYIHLLAYFLVLSNVFRKRDWFIFFNAFIVSGLIEGGYALMQKTGVIIGSTQGGFRVDGTIGNPTYLAAFMIFIVGFCSLLFLKTKNVYARIYYALAGLFSLMIIYFTASRGPVLGILIALVLAGIGYLLFSPYGRSALEEKKVETDSDRKIRKILLGGLIALVVVISIIWGLKNTDFVKNSQTLSRLTNLSFSEQTITSRFSIWQMSFEAFKERPILGWGPENYVVVFSKYYSPEMWKQEPWFDRSHNIIFDWLINAGILGLLSYLAILFFAVRELYKNYQNKKISFEELILIVGVFVAYFFQNLFVFDNIATYISFFAILAWIYSVSTGEEMEKLEREKPAMDVNYFPVVLFIVFLVMSFYAYQITIKPYRENKYLIQAMISGNRKDFSSSFDYYQKALGLNAFLGRDEVVGQYINFAVVAVKDQSLSADKKQEIIGLVIKELEWSRERNPLDPRSLMYAGLFYQAVGDLDVAIENMEAARKLSPNKQDILSNLGKLYLGKEDYEKALPILLEDFNEDQAYPEARVDLAGAYILMGDQDTADKLLLEGFGKIDVAYDFLLRAYSAVKNVDRLLNTWKVFVDQNPTNTNYLKGLAGAYLLNNQKENALETLRSILIIDPSLESEINGYISQIRSSQL